MTDKLPQHIESMVQKNNLVMAIKSLAAEKNISMDEAKIMIDTYEEDVKNKRIAEQEKIKRKQEKKPLALQKLSPLKKRLNEQGITKSLTPYVLKTLIILLFGTLLIAAIGKFLT